MRTMLSLQEFMGDTPLITSSGFNHYKYAILVDPKQKKLFVCEYTNIFLLIDLIMNHEILSGVIIYRTQLTVPSMDQLQGIRDNLLAH